MAVSIRNRLFIACESFLRVPPLLIVDEIFRTSFGLGGNIFKHNSSPDSSDSSAQTYNGNSINPTQFEEDNSLNDSELLSQDSSLWSSVSQNESEFLNPTNNSLTSSISSYLSFMMDSWLLAEEYIKNETMNFIHGGVESIQPESDKIINSTLIFKLNVDEFTTATEELTKDLIVCGEVFGSIFLFFAAVVMFMLATENLIKLYSYLISFLTLYVAFSTTSIVPSPLSVSSFPFIILNVLFRTVLATIFFACKSWPTGTQQQQRDRGSWSLIDLLLFSMFFLCGIFRIPSVIYILLVTLFHHSLILSLPKVYHFLISSWGETKRVQNEYGLSHLIQVESGRLRINTVFRLFWITRATYDAFFRCCDEPFSLIIRYVMTHGTETFTGIIGLTVTVAAICHQIGDFLLWILYLGANNEVDANRFGSISTVLFFILSLQTGLTSLDPEKRLDRLMKNIVLLGTALFHALHQMVAPLLHAFRSFQAVQIRAATVSCTFLVFSFLLTVYVLRWSTLSTWSLAVLALAIEFKIKVIISLIISLVVYLSQLVQYPDVIEKFVSFCRRFLPQFIMRFFDQLYDQISHEDMVFYLKTFANVAEFITGIFLFVNAVWIFLFESASAIRAIGMSIHAYFNIWCEAQKGFRIYCQRKTASKKIMSLADATDEQIRNRNDDVCSICYEGFESAKVTNCGHLFHAVCLRKWLYVQNTCPMCHEILYKEENINETPQHDENNPQPNLNDGLGNHNNLSDSEAEEVVEVPQENLRVLRETPSRQEPNGNIVVEQQERDTDIRRYIVQNEIPFYDLVSDDSSSDAGYPLDEDDGSSGVEIDTDDEEDDDHVGIQQNRGLVVFL